MNENQELFYRKKQYVNCIQLLLILVIGEGILTSSIVLGKGKQGIVKAKIAIDDPRPIAEAVRQLQSKYGIAITYEDPPYAFKGDIKDETAPEYIRSHPNGFRALVPKGGHLEFYYQVSPATEKPINISNLLGDMLQAHLRAGLPGRFRLKQSGEIFHIVPSQIRNAQGNWMNVDSVLNVRISFPKQERTLFETLQTILKEVRQVSGTEVKITSIPKRWGWQAKTIQGASEEYAEQVLVKVLESSHMRFSWSLLYGHMKWYALNIRSV